MRNGALLAPLFATLLLAGCVNLPAIKQPSPELPAAWPDGPQQRVGEISNTWWQLFKDPTLDLLMQEALANNQDLKLAAARILEAEANLKTAGAALLPEVSASLGASRNRRSEVGSVPVPGNPYYSSYSGNLQASYEIDIWGRIAAGNEAARADLLATRMGAEVVRLSLSHNVAQAYFNLLALAARERLTRDTLTNRNAATALMQRRLEVGLTSALEVRQAQAEAAALESALAQVDQLARQQENALGTLLGRSPRALVEQRLQAEALQARAEPPEVPAGLPSELLQRRPDLRQAEAALAASQASIHEARAALFPSLALTARLGSESKSLSDLFSGPATVWGLGIGLAQSVFNGGRTEAALQARSARQDQALASYESAARQAFREVLDALVAHRQAREVWAAEGKRVEALAESARLSEARFAAGAASQLEVLDTQRNLFQAEQGRIEASRARLAAATGLIKALGGGWRGEGP